MYFWMAEPCGCEGDSHWTPLGQGNPAGVNEAEFPLTYENGRPWIEGMSTSGREEYLMV